MNNKDTGIVLALLSVLVSILMVFTYFLSAGANLSVSENALWRAETRLSGLRASNTSVLSSVSANATNIVSFVPMVVALGVVIAICVGLYTMIQKEKKKSRVAFVKPRDIKRIAPDAYAKKKSFEKSQVSQLNRENRNNKTHRWGASPTGFDSEITDLARIAKINAMNKMAMPGMEIEDEEF